MKVKSGTYFWLFAAVAFVLVGIWKCYSVASGAPAVGAEGDSLGKWITVLGLALAFFAWRCYRFVEEKKTAEFLAKERKKAAEIERRIKQEQADRDKKWFEEQRVRV